jgi:hypothetical protein
MARSLRLKETAKAARPHHPDVWHSGCPGAGVEECRRVHNEISFG